MIHGIQRRLAVSVSGFALLAALGGVAHADDAIATSSGVAAPIAVGAAAGLAQAQAEPAEDTAVTEVVVTGFRNSLQRALELKRTNTGVVDSILAEDIAKFPDNNLAESIQRIPGVAISRDQGEGRALSVRGLGPDFTRVRINGMEAQASTDGYNGANRGRGFDFNVFASELFNRIDVRKTPSADTEEGSLGATVDLVTGHPFDYKGFKLAASAQAGYNTQTEKTRPRMALLVSNTFADDKLGALFSVAYSKTAVNFQQSSSGLWTNGPSDGGWCRPTSGTGGICDVSAAELPRATELYNLASSANTYYPRFMRYVQGLGRTERLGLTGSLQWAPTDDTKVTLDGLFSRYKVSRDDWPIEAIGFSRGASQGGKPEMLVRDMILDRNNTMVYGLFDNVDMRSEHNRDEFSTDFGQWTLTAEHKFNDKFSIDGVAGYSFSDFDNFNDISTQIDRFNVDGYSVDTRPNGQYRPAINFGFDVTNPALWYFGPTVTQPGGTGPTGPEIRLRPNYTDNKYKTVQINGKYALTDNLTLKAGANWKQYDFSAQSYRFALGEANFPAIPAGYTIQTLTEQFCGLGKMNVPSPTPTCWTTPNIDAFAAAYNIYGNTGRTALSQTVASVRGENREVQEENKTGYVMANFDYDVGGWRVRGDVGVRHVQTQQTSSFYTNVPTSVNAAGFVYTTVKRKYDDTLPSMNLVVEPTENLLLRFAAAKVMARPALSALAAATSVSVAGGSRSVSTGNVNLEPYRAKTLDASIEWYPKPGVILSAGVFYKDISTYVQTLTRIQPYSATGLPVSLLEGTGVGPNDEFSVTNVVNTDGGPLKGVELNYQQPLDFLPDMFRGFGILANYTYVDSSIDYIVDPNPATYRAVNAPLLNLSKHAANATLYYERGPLQARVSVNYRDKYLTAVPGRYNQDVQGTLSTTFFDASTSYKINDQLTVSLEALNLSNEKDISYIDSKAQRFENYRVAGRQFFLGVRYTY
jgi:iron complex outermembrane receptor protein